ncbi:MAG TPA: hypothetical protein VKF62_04880, partial [Planctomycetota bacterium]|nr:hypothetical protein [Planctomycetota bacterium]
DEGSELLRPEPRKPLVLEVHVRQPFPGDFAARRSLRVWLRNVVFSDRRILTIASAFPGKWMAPWSRRGVPWGMGPASDSASF